MGHLPTTEAARSNNLRPERQSLQEILNSY